MLNRPYCLGHELIDPMEPGADAELTYPIILQMIDDPAAVGGAAAAR